MMVQSLTVPVPEEVWLGIDIGTVTAKVAVLEVTDPANPAEFVDYPLKFPTNNRNQTTTELDTTLVFSKDGLTCTHGSGGLSYPEAHFFRDWKPGAMGLPPFAQILTNACRLLQKSAPQIKDFTPGTLFRTLLSHIAKTARDHIQNIYGHDIEVIRCILTYPVSCSEALQILLLQEASAAGLDVMGALSESMATAYSLQSHPRLTLLKGAKMFLDYGGATLDGAVTYENDNGEIAQACPTIGYPFGGEMINQLGRDWLRLQCPDWIALNDEIQWALVISTQFDQCKFQFDGQSDHNIYDGKGNTVTIPCDVMKSFFEPLMLAGLEIAPRLCEGARAAGYSIAAAVVSGGGGGNRWFIEEFSRRLREETGITECVWMQEPGVVASGALRYALSPLVERCVSNRKLGLTYYGDYKKSGESLKKRGRWHNGIAWLMREGEDPAKLPDCLRFTKRIKPGSKDPGDHIIKSELYASPGNSKTFSQKYIGNNDLIAWDCDITYPATKAIFRQLTHLGTFSGIVPHEEFFPLGTETDEIKVEFQLTLELHRQLWRGVFSALRKDGSLCSLREVRFTPLPLVPWSQFMNERIRLKPHFETRVSSQEPRPTSEHESPVSPESSATLPLEGVVIGPRAESQPANSPSLPRELSPGLVVRSPRPSGNDPSVSPEKSSSPTLPPQHVIRTRYLRQSRRFSPSSSRLRISEADLKAASDSRRRKQAIDGQHGGQNYPRQLQAAM